MNEVKEYKDELEQEWKEVQRILRSYPQHFDPSRINKETFFWLFSCVCSRCFGWGMPTTAMIPMADNLNHAPISVQNETIHKKLHLLGSDQEGTYY